MSFPIPTSLGLKAALFYVLLLAAFFAAPYSNLFFLLLTFLTILGLVNVVSNRRNLAGVSGALDEIEPVPAGAGGSVGARLHAGGRRRFALGVRVELEGLDPIESIAGLVEGEARVVARVPPLVRGVHPIKRAFLNSTWPLGLLRSRIPLDAPDALIVYPAPAALADERDGATGAGDVYTALGGQGFLQPSSLREYREGDELRLVHWKASARRGALVIKEFEGGTGSGFEVVLDRRAGAAAFERALSLLSALALAAREQKEPLAVHSQGFSETFGSGRRPWRELLLFLAATQPLPAGAEAPPQVSPSVLRLPRGGAA